MILVKSMNDKTQNKSEQQKIAENICNKMQAQWEMTDKEKSKFISKQKRAMKCKKHGCVDW